MKQKLFSYLSVFLIIFGLNQLILFTTTIFIFWSLNPLVWSELGRGGFYVLTMFNLLLSGFLSSFITINNWGKK